MTDLGPTPDGPVSAYPICEWVDAPGVRYMRVDGELELLPGLRLVPAPGHTRGMQVVVVETGGRLVVVGGDVAVWFDEFNEPKGQRRVLSLDPELIWLAHEPWRPRTGITPALFEWRGSTYQPRPSADHIALHLGRGTRLTCSTGHLWAGKNDYQPLCISIVYVKNSVDTRRDHRLLKI